jgi:hypothetical protein
MVDNYAKQGLKEKINASSIFVLQHRNSRFILGISF